MSVRFRKSFFTIAGSSVEKSPVKFGFSTLANKFNFILRGVQGSCHLVRESVFSGLVFKHKAGADLQFFLQKHTHKFKILKSNMNQINLRNRNEREESQIYCHSYK